MTGFGKAEATVGNKKFSVEIKSLNSKAFDLNLRMPNIYREKEMELRTWLGENIQRGKADVIIYYETIVPEKRMAFNKELMIAYYADLKEVADKTGMSNGDFLNAMIRIPDVLKPENQEMDEDEWKGLLSAVHEAYKRFDQYRTIEGARTKKEFEDRLGYILKGREELLPLIEIRAQKVKDKLHASLEESIGKDKIDPNRFEQEIIYYLERLDISEEFHRLETNCQHFLDELNLDGQGKKLGFITQEIGREINTIGSKANDADIQKVVVNMKDELEKIKEQIFNVL
ncbi:MAG: YicC/YloC family endoribonuclease [Flavobacteriales bacterium]|nr:YicC/YloC family endoribonuclease [Flavobacteriales bacterium]